MGTKIMNEQSGPEIVVFGTSWCGACHRTIRFFDERKIPHRYHDVEEEDLSELVIKMNESAGYGPRRRVPTLVVGEEILPVPSRAKLAQRLGLE
jgi:glutaredoxin